MRFEMAPDVHWVGKLDWELRKFHGEECSTHASHFLHRGPGRHQTLGRGGQAREHQELF
jgi:hypothetical protein